PVPLPPARVGWPHVARRRRRRDGQLARLRPRARRRRLSRDPHPRARGLALDAPALDGHPADPQLGRRGVVRSTGARARHRRRARADRAADVVRRVVVYGTGPPAREQANSEYETDNVILDILVTSWRLSE